MHIQLFQTEYLFTMQKEIRNNTNNRQLTAAEKIAGLNKVWSEDKFGFANFDLVPALNWDLAYLACIPKVEVAKTTSDYYNVLKQFNHLLRHGYSRILKLPSIDATLMKAVKRIKSRTK